MELPAKRIRKASTEYDQIGDYRREIVSLCDTKFYWKGIIMNRKQHGWLKGSHINDGESYLTIEEKIGKLLSLRGKNHRVRIQLALKKHKKNVLEVIYKKFINSRIRKKPKEKIIEEMIVHFFQEEQVSQKREEEKENIACVDFSQVFITLCGTLVPKEIITEILSYLHYNLKLLCVIGSLNKSFYTIILTTWSSVRVSQTNYEKISLVVLRNVKEIVLTTSLRNDALKYVFFTNYSPNLRSIEFDFNKNKLPTPAFIRRFFRNFKNFTKKKKNRNSFQGIREISFNCGLCYGTSYMGKLSLHKENWDFSINESGFHNVEVVKNPPSMKLIDGMVKLRTLVLRIMDKCISEYIYDSYDDEDPPLFDEKDLEYISKDSSIREIIVTGDSDFVVKLIKRCSKTLRRLSICDPEEYGEKCFNDHDGLNFLSELINLEYLYLGFPLRKRHIIPHLPDSLKHFESNFSYYEEIDYDSHTERNVVDEMYEDKKKFVGLFISIFERMKNLEVIELYWSGLLDNPFIFNLNKRTKKLDIFLGDCNEKIFSRMFNRFFDEFFDQVSNNIRFFKVEMVGKYYKNYLDDDFKEKFELEQFSKRIVKFNKKHKKRRKIYYFEKKM